MNNLKFLKAHLSLLRSQYGDTAILDILADLRRQPIQEVEALLTEITRVGHTKTKKLPPARDRSNIDSILKDHPEKTEVLRAIKARFDNRTLFAELKDIRRFLEKNGQAAQSLKARSEAFPRVARILAELPLADLESLLATQDSNDFSSLGVISDEILGRKQ